MMLSLLKQLAQIFTWFVVVAPWEQAIRVRLGKHVTLLNAGAYVRIPFVDRCFKQSVRRRLTLIRSQTLTTTDARVITCSAALGFSIGDLRKLYDTLESPNDTLENEVAAIISRFIGSRPWNECSSPALEAFVKKELDLEKYGLTGQEFYITSLAAAKAYRFITGDLGTWHRDEQLNMKAESNNQQ